MNPVVLVTGSFLPWLRMRKPPASISSAGPSRIGETWGNYSELWYRTHSMAQNCALKAGDSLFARSGSRYTAPVGSKRCGGRQLLQGLVHAGRRPAGSRARVSAAKETGSATR